jgi:L-seryl-tRNA(Ser) seleniumtransferase
MKRLTRSVDMDSTQKQELLRHIPSVDRLLATEPIQQAMARTPRTLVVRAVQGTLQDLRNEILKSESVPVPSDLSLASVSERVLETLDRLAMPSLRSVINATGVVVHTNLGRSILAESVIDRFGPLSGGYSNLEYDLSKGRRGSRYTHVEGILRELTSAEAANVVNNNAAAVLLALDTLARGREVIVSRGQLVEIGGSFRVPDVMKKSGCKMVEVGTTNKTHLSDYEGAVGPDTALLLKVHKSNFQVVGFTEDVPLADLVQLGHAHGIAVMEDLGSGCLIDLSKLGLPKEPTVQEVLGQGADLVTFSGDKLLGGPQAGIILGRKDLVDAIKKNQLTRALRIDKLTLLALEETLRLYRDERLALMEIPTLRMLSEPYEGVRRRARRLKRLIGPIEGGNFSLRQEDGSSKAGGGALPLLEIPTRLLCLIPAGMPSHFMEVWLRSYEPPVIGRLERDRFVLDVRTIQDKELPVVAQAVRTLSGLEMA